MFDAHAVGDQLYLQAEAELQGAQAWVAMAAATTDENDRRVLERCAALEAESSVVVKALLDALND